MDTICFLGGAGLALVIGWAIGRFREKPMTMSTFLQFLFGGSLGIALVSNFTEPATPVLDRLLASLALSFFVSGPLFLGAIIGRYMRKH